MEAIQWPCECHVAFGRVATRRSGRVVASHVHGDGLAEMARAIRCGLRSRTKYSFFLACVLCVCVFGTDSRVRGVFFSLPEGKLRWLELEGGGHFACGTRYTGYTGWSAWRAQSRRLLRHRIGLLLLAGCVAAANQTSRCCCLSSARNECTAGGIEPEHASLARCVSLSRTSDVYADVCPPSVVRSPPSVPPGSLTCHARRNRRLGRRSDFQHDSQLAGSRVRACVSKTSQLVRGGR